MKRKKINSLIAFSVALSSFNLLTGDPILAIAGTEQIQQNQKDSKSESYYENLYKKFNSQINSKNISVSSKKALDNSKTANKSNLTNLFKVQLSSNDNCTYLDCHKNDKNDNCTINLPESNSVYSNSYLTIVPNKDISDLTLKIGESYLNYKDLSKNKYQVIKDFNLKSTKSFEVYIKYADNTPLVSQTFNINKIKNDDLSINNVKVDYNTENDKVLAELSWVENSKNTLYKQDESTKKVYFNGTFYDAKNNGSNNYSITIDVTDVSDLTDATIYSCNDIYQVSSAVKQLANPFINKGINKEAVETSFYFSKENYESNSVEQIKIDKDSTIYFDGSTLPNGTTTEFPIDIKSNQNIKNVTITLNGNNVLDNTFSETLKEFSTKLTLNSDENNLSIKSTDINGNETEIPFKVIVDTSYHSLHSNLNVNTELNNNSKYFVAEDCNITSYIENEYNEDINAGTIKVTDKLTSFDNKEVTKDLDYSIDDYFINISNINDGTNEISFTFTDKYNRQFRNNFTIVKNTSRCSIKDTIASEIGTSDNVIASQNSEIIISDATTSVDKLNIDDKDIYNPRESSFLFNIQDKNGQAVNVDKSKLSKKLNEDGTISINFKDVFKKLSDGDYTINYAYYNNIKEKADYDDNNGSKSFSTLNDNVDCDYKLVNANQKSFIENQTDFKLFKDSCTISLNENNSLFNLFRNQDSDIIVNSKNSKDNKNNKQNPADSDNNLVTANITKLINYSDNNSKAPDMTTVLSKNTSSLTLNEEGYYKIDLTSKDYFGNISKPITLYVAITKEKPEISYNYDEKIDSNSNPSMPRETDIFTNPVSPTIKVKGVALTNGEVNAFKNSEDIKMPLQETKNQKYGEIDYKLNDEKDKPIYLENMILTLSGEQHFVSFDNNSKSQIYNKVIIENEKPEIIATINDTEIFDNSVVHLNTKPELTFTATNMIDESTFNNFDVAQAEKANLFVLDSKGNDCSDKFVVNVKNDPTNFKTYYNVSFKGDLKDNNNYYKLKFSCSNAKGVIEEKDVNIILDTESPSFIMNFYSTDKSEDQLDKDHNGNIIFDENDKLKINGDKTLGEFGNGEKDSPYRIFCNYSSLYLNVEALDNSSDFIDSTEKLLKEFKVSINSDDVNLEHSLIDSNTFKFDLSSIKDGKYNINLKATDESGNSTDLSDRIYLYYNRTTPNVSINYTKDEEHYDVTQYDYKIANDKVYFNKSITPFITIQSPLIRYGLINNSEDIKTYFNIDLNDADLDYDNTTINGESIVIPLGTYEDGKYDISGKVTDLCNNETNTLYTSLTGNNEVNLPFVVDTQSPTADLYLNTSEGIDKVSRYNSDNGSIYIAVNDANLNIDRFLNNENGDLHLYYSDDFENEDCTDEMKDITIEDVTSDVSDTVKNSVGYDENTTIFKISNNGNDFENGHYSISYKLYDYSGNCTPLTTYNFTMDSEDINVNEHGYDFNQIYFNSDVNINFDVKEHYSGFSYSTIRLTKDGEDVTDNYINNSFNNSANGGSINVSIPLNDYNKSTEGKYNLTVNIRDKVGREYSRNYSFYMDRTAITLNDFNVNLGDGQIKDGIYYTNAQDVNVRFASSDNISGEESREVKVNGNIVDASNNSISNDYFTTDGEYTISLDFVDKCGNESSYSYKIIVDRTAPTVNLDGFQGVTDPEDGFLYINHSVYPEVIVSDNFGEDISKRTAFLNGSVYTASSISENGHLNYMVDVYDLAGNKSTQNIEFVLDTIAPDVNISDVEDYKYYNREVLPNYSTDDIDAKLEAYLNGTPYDGSAISADGEYNLHFVCTDKAKNVTEKNVTFYIDTVAPEISVFGVNENQVNGILTPIIETDDPTATLTAYLNGENYYGGEINESGKYVLVVNAIDRAGNSSERIVTFLVDADLPQITVKNIEDGKSYKPGLQPDISVSKNASYTMTLNGEEYDGSAINDEDEYELVIDAVDDYNNKNTAKLNFTISNDAKASTLYKNSFNEPDSDENTDDPTLMKVIFGSISALILLIISFILFLFFKKKRKKDIPVEDIIDTNDFDE